MKPNRWFSRPNTVLSTLRIAIAGALVVAAGSMAFVAAKTKPAATATAKQAVQPSLRESFMAAKAAAEKADLAEFKPGQNRKTFYGEANETRHPDYTPDIENYLNRAYPMDEIPMKATMRAQQGWAALVAASASSPSFAQLGVWKLIGPDAATYPGVLNLLGDGGAYIASGRVTALAIAPTCVAGNCKIYLGAAGGGVWSTPDGLSNAPTWTFLSQGFGTNAIGSLYIDKNVASGNTIFAGTGEPNVSGDSEAGVGIYKSTDGGATWALFGDSAKFGGRAISGIDTTPNGSVLAAVARAVRGVSSVTGGSASNPPGNTFIAVGLYRLTPPATTFTQIFTVPAGPGVPRGLNEVHRDPDNFIGDVTYYIGVLGNGIYRTTDGGTSWVQIKTPFSGADSADRAEFGLAPSGNPVAPAYVRMYVGNGSGTFGARFYSTQGFDVLTATNATFFDETTAQNIDYCTGQCWYDNFVHSPVRVVAGSNVGLDIVYLLGSFDYNQIEAFGSGKSNGRAVLLSTDQSSSTTVATPGTWSDLTQDAKPDPSTHEWTHPDQHAIVTNPNNVFQYWEGNDGGIIRSSGVFGDISEECTENPRFSQLSPADVAYCQAILNRVPTALFSLNKGLSTLQFQSLSATSFITNKKNGHSTTTLQGGTQDNGTFQYIGLGGVWPQIMYGDGGQSGFSAIAEARRFNTFTGKANDVNFNSGDPTGWYFASGPIFFSGESAQFYPPVIADPVLGDTIFQGSQAVWRTQDWGGPNVFSCPELGAFTIPANLCGDFVRIGNGVPSVFLTSATWGGTRGGGNIAAVERNTANGQTLWAATIFGRVFYSGNGNAAAGSVVWEKLDESAADTASPPRFISSIFPNPSNTSQAFVSYSGYNFSTPARPGHVFIVTRVGASNASWTDISYNLPDLPVTDLVRHNSTGDLYAASDFGVVRLPFGTTTWIVAGSGLPFVECAGLTLFQSTHVLYLASHGRSAWQLGLPGSQQ